MGNSRDVVAGEPGSESRRGDLARNGLATCPELVDHQERSVA